MDMQYQESILGATHLDLGLSINKNHIGEIETPFLYLHWHKDFEFIIVTDGQLNVTIEGRVFRIHSGECIFIHPYFIHSAVVSQGESCNFYNITFSPEYLFSDKHSQMYTNYIEPLMSKRLFFTEYLSQDLEQTSKVYRILNDLCDIYFSEDSEPSNNVLLLRSRLYETWHIYFNYLCSSPSPHPISKKKIIKFSAVLDYIHINYACDISLQQLSDVISVSESQLYRLFKEELGIAPFTYIIRHRILTSCTLLSETNEKISAIAFKIGFGNISYYNREFKKFIGCTPSEYRKYCKKVI